MNEIKFEVFLPSYAFREVHPDDLYSCVRKVALKCESLGYDSLWLDDHLMYGQTPMFECWTLLSFIATITSRIRLGTMVTSVGFRNPALLAKMATTVDHISGGRLEFGIGAGIQIQEHQAYGYSFPKIKERAERVDEALEIIKNLWTKTETSYTGRHFYVSKAVCEPKPVQKPYPQITVGGSGERYLLGVVAKHANRFDFGFQPSVDDYVHKLKVLEGLCTRVGRNFRDIQKSCWPTGQMIIDKNHSSLAKKIERYKPDNISMEEFLKYTFTGTPDEAETILKPYLSLGVNRFVLFFLDLPKLESLKLFANISGDWK